MLSIRRKNLAVTFAVMIVVIAVSLGIRQWVITSQWKRSYARVTGGMTLDQVRQAMGRDEDEPDERLTTTGEFERSFTFAESGICLTVVFSPDGVSTYKELGPIYCGVTPLMGKYVEK
jgi:hypothetical protein